MAFGKLDFRKTDIQENGFRKNKISGNWIQEKCTFGEKNSEKQISEFRAVIIQRVEFQNILFGSVVLKLPIFRFRFNNGPYYSKLYRVLILISV